MNARNRRIVAALLVVCLCYAAAVGALIGADNRRSEEGMDDILYLPNEKLLTYFTAGLNTIVANFLWLHCIQYTALEHRGQRHFTWLEHMLFTATRLDPHFVDVYRFGAMFLSALRADPEASLRLAEAGMVKNPMSWHLPYEAAMTYLLNKRDHPEARYYAARYLNMSVATGQALGGIVNLAAKLQDEFELTEIERDMWVEMLDSDDKFIRELAERKLIEMDLRKACRILDERIDLFVTRTGEQPQTLDDLLAADLIAAMPEDPLGGEFFIGADGRTYNTTLLEDNVIQTRNILLTNIGYYEERYGALPASLERLVDVGLLEEIPPHPWPNRQWQYDAATGDVE